MFSNGKKKLWEVKSTDKQFFINQVEYVTMNSTELPYDVLQELKLYQVLPIILETIVFQDFSRILEKFRRNQFSKKVWGGKFSNFENSENPGQIKTNPWQIK